MKKNLLTLPLALATTLGLLAGCGGGEQEGGTIDVWVGLESAEFYKTVAADFKAANPDFKYDIKITGSDSGTNGGAMVQDNTACGDIVTIAHDNIGKLSQLSYIQPITDEGLLAQIEEDNPDSFKTVIKNTLGTSSDVYTFAVPYISQALFLYYDTRVFTAPEDVATFERMAEVAKAKNMKSYTITGTDGFNLSFPILARKLPGNTTELRLYENAQKYETYFQANEQIAVSRWTQSSFADPNGGMMPTDSGWAVDVKNGKVGAVIGGAWKYNEFKSAVTDDNGVAHIGCALIPTFKLTAANVEGINEIPAEASLTGKVDPAPVAGTEFRGGTFADCKCFVMNMAAEPAKYASLVKLVKYFSSKEVQQKSFLSALNVPAYKGAADYIESVKNQVEESAYLMAKAQTGMAEYGIPQPFVNGTLNTFYYQDSAPDYLKEAYINEKGNFSSVDAMRELHFKVEYVWKHGSLPASYPGTYPHDTTERIK